MIAPILFWPPGRITAPLLVTPPVIVPTPVSSPPLKIMGVVLVTAPPFRRVEPALCVKPPLKVSWPKFKSRMAALVKGTSIVTVELLVKRNWPVPSWLKALPLPMLAHVELAARLTKPLLLMTAPFASVKPPFTVMSGPTVIVRPSSTPPPLMAS